MLDVQHLTKRYGALTGIQDVSFTVRPGEVLRKSRICAALTAEENVEDRRLELIRAMKA